MSHREMRESRIGVAACGLVALLLLGALGGFSPLAVGPEGHGRTGPASVSTGAVPPNAFSLAAPITSTTALEQSQRGGAGKASSSSALSYALDRGAIPALAPTPVPRAVPFGLRDFVAHPPTAPPLGDATAG